MKGFLRFTALFIVINSVINNCYSQISAVQITPDQAINQTLLGGGVTATNITGLNTTATQIGRFSNGLSANIGIDCGLILISGNINPTAGPLSTMGLAATASDPTGSGGDPNLALIASGSVNDAAVIQFDFVPTGNSINFRYVFASEEYNDFVNSSFNDVFGFFLSGPNPSGGTYNATNLALIPGTSAPVTINTVNNGNSGGCGPGPCENCQYFVDNCNQNVPFIFDGHTTVLTATAAVTPGQTYTIKLAVADVADGALDAAVFLEANSFSSGTSQVLPTYNFAGAVSDTALYEGCADLTLKFVRTGDLTLADTAFFTITGSATNGVDYGIGSNPVPNFVVFAPGQDTVVLVITPYADALFTEGNETFAFLVASTNPCGDSVLTGISFTITNVTELTVDAGPNITICPGKDITLNANIQGGVPPYGIAWTYPGGTADTNNVVVSSPQNGYYKIVVQDGCSLFPTVVDSFLVTITTAPFQINLSAVNPACVDSANGGVNTTITGNTPPFTFLWSNNSTDQSPTGLAEGTYSVIVTDANGCADSSTVTLTDPAANVQLKLPPNFKICGDQSVSIMVPDSINATGYSWSTGETTQVISVNQANTYTVTITHPCGPQTSSTVVEKQNLVKASDLPNILTPNGDGVNDALIVDFFKDATNFNMKIYNRWGNKVLDTNDLSINWTPENNSDGVYFYVIKYISCNGEEDLIKGNITLARPK